MDEKKRIGLAMCGSYCTYAEVFYHAEELAEKFSRFAVEGKSQLTFLIGGSVGLHPALKTQADLRLSMSPMTFPHHLARVMLLEQIYRGYQILEGSKYHK